MNIDPRLPTDYLGKMGLDDQRVVGDLVDHLCSAPEPRGEALHLHQLRVLDTAKLGEPEGSLFERIAVDRPRPGPVKSWAWKAFSVTPRCRPTTLMEAADAEEDPGVRRAIVLGLRKAGVSGQRRTVFRSMERRDPDLRFAGRWLEEVA